MEKQLKYKNDLRIIDEINKDGVLYLSYPLLADTGLVVDGFSTKIGGVSKGYCKSMNISKTRGDNPEDIEENKKLLGKVMGFDPNHMVYTHQTHTTNVKRVGKADYGKSFLDTDGLITNEKHVVLVTFFADCVPLYFLDPVNKAIGLSHSGWRGTVNRMGKVTIEMMTKEFGTDPNDLICAIGPSICKDCFEVGDEVVDEFKKAFDKKYYDELFERYPNGKYHIDLWKANEIVLMEAGVRWDNIAVTNVCTMENSDLLFSHRVVGFERGNLSAFLELK
ncbi:MAG: peptidoglycan editing factor PgeF [Lachnospiraceae bacterium]|jgi:YfiH family protein|nr:peptidoglycan editing factor PgeF [Lachnospiraceae bacterium]